MKPRIPYDAVAKAITALRVYRIRGLIERIGLAATRAERNRFDVEETVRHALNYHKPVPSYLACAIQRDTHRIAIGRARIDKLTVALTATPIIHEEKIEAVRAHLGLLVTNFYTYAGGAPPWVTHRYRYYNDTDINTSWIVFHTPTIDVGDLAVWRARYAFWLPLVSNFRNSVYMRAIRHEIKGPHRYAHPTVEHGGWFCLDGFTPHVHKALQHNDLPRAISIILTAIANGAPKSYIIDRCGDRHHDRVYRELARRTAA